MEPYIRPDMEELLRICNGLIRYLSDEEGEDIACIVVFLRQQTVCPDDDVDDLSASMAFSQLPSID